jgi:hypothetical protein
LRDSRRNPERFQKRDRTEGWAPMRQPRAIARTYANPATEGKTRRNQTQRDTGPMSPEACPDHLVQMLVTVTS